MKKNQGFTLVELMIVVAIIAILAAVVIPQLADQVNKSKDSKALVALASTRTNLSAATSELEGQLPTLGSGANLWRGGVVASNTDNGVYTEVRVVYGFTNNIFTEAGAVNKPEIQYIWSSSPLIEGRNIIMNNGVDTKGRNWSDY